MDISGITSAYYNTAKTESSSAAAGSVQNSLSGISKDSSDEELLGAIKDFESYFVEQMLKEIKKSLKSEEEDSVGSQYTDMYMDTVIEQVADELVDDVGESLTQQLFEQMKRNIGTA